MFKTSRPPGGRAIKHCPSEAEPAGLLDRGGASLVKAVRVHAPGGPEALRYEDVEVPTAGEGQAVVKIAASGLNFIDVQFRAGKYPPPASPFTLGMEGA